jgi:hypothetical protein
MLDHLFKTYGNITAVNLEINFENMRRAWDPQQPVESLFKQIQDCANYYEAGGVLIGHPQQINVGYAKIFTTGHFMSACRRWNEKHTIEKTWTQFKSHFAASHRQHKLVQGESAATAGYHSVNAAVTHNEDQMAEATIGALASLATATAADRGVVAALTQANAIWPRSWRKTQKSCGNSRRCSIRNAVQSAARAASTPHPPITAVLMASKLVALTRISLAKCQNPATKKRPLKRIQWEVVNPTGNDVPGRQL